MFKKRINGFILMVIGIFVISINYSFAQNVEVSLISAPFGTSSYVLGSALEKIIRDSGIDVTLTHTETPGVAYNIKKLEKDSNLKTITIFAGATLLVEMAHQGSEPFKESMGKGIVPIAYYNTNGSFFVTRDKSINTLQDLKGKKVGIGTKQQSGFSTVPFMTLKYGAGLEEKDLNLQWIGTDASIEAFKNRVIDACIVGGYFNPASGEFIPAPFFQELLVTENDLHYIDTGDAVLKKTAEETGLSFPAYNLKKDQIKYLERSIDISVSPVGWYAYREFPEEVVYKITKQIILNVEKFGQYHGLGKLMTKEMLCWNMTPDNIHPGAYKAYKEFNLMK